MRKGNGEISQGKWEKRRKKPKTFMRRRLRKNTEE